MWVIKNRPSKTHQKTGVQVGKGITHADSVLDGASDQRIVPVDKHRE